MAGNDGLESEAEVEFATVDAFTDKSFGGNPAAVCFLPYEKEDEWLQRVAGEFNLSETAFVIKRPGTGADDVVEYDLRWFTPKFEVDLCGHATLAAAHSLFSTRVDQNKIKFHSRSGALIARRVSGYEEPPRRATGAKGVVELDFPLCLASPCDPQETLKVCASLRIPDSIWCGKNELGYYLVELSSSEQVINLNPDFEKMMDFSGPGGVIVTAQASEKSEADFISRFFCPKAGVVEDPVTGSAHCTLGPYWSRKLERSQLTGYQASDRGGKVFVRVDEAEGRAYLQGSAITVMAGVLLNAEK